MKDVFVEAARLKELEYFAGIGVWKKVPKNRAREATGKPRLRLGGSTSTNVMKRTPTIDHA